MNETLEENSAAFSRMGEYPANVEFRAQDQPVFRNPAAIPFTVSNRARR